MSRQPSPRPASKASQSAKLAAREPDEAPQPFPDHLVRPAIARGARKTRAPGYAGHNKYGKVTIVVDGVEASFQTPFRGGDLNDLHIKDVTSLSDFELARLGEQAGQQAAKASEAAGVAIPVLVDGKLTFATESDR